MASGSAASATAAAAANREFLRSLEAERHADKAFDSGLAADLADLEALEQELATGGLLSGDSGGSGNEDDGEGGGSSEADASATAEAAMSAAARAHAPTRAAAKERAAAAQQSAKAAQKAARQEANLGQLRRRRLRKMQRGWQHPAKALRQRRAVQSLLPRLEQVVWFSQVVALILAVQAPWPPPF